MEGAEYRVLGPLKVLFKGTPVPVPAGRCQVLLAALLLRPNQFVSADELIDLVWDGAPPRLDRAKATLQVVVRRLRTALGDANCVRTVTHGYEATVEHDQLDLLRFRALVGAGEFSAATALWRGPVLGNVASETLHRDHVPGLVDERLAVLERRIDADLDRGLAGDLIAELRSLVIEHPLREQFWAQLMIALYRMGQQAEALTVYGQVSRMLAEELGIDPGVTLREVHQSILRAEPELTPQRMIVTPRQLPPDLARFTGRTVDLAELDRLLPTGTAGQAVVISAIEGTAGVGKTALAVHWAHRVRGRFPDGQLMINLRGYDREEPLTPHDALGQLLRGLGLSSSDIPDDTGQRTGAYRSLLADRRVLVLLDNARTAEQVRPLLPAGGRSIVVITSRSDLRGLVALNDASVLRLGTMPSPDAVQLLTRVIGDRALAEPSATAELAQLCAGLPLALRIAGSLLAGAPHGRVQDLVDQLSTGDRLAELEIENDQEAAVRAAFDLSYAALQADERQMFRMLGLAPRADFTPQSAGALLGVPSHQALRLLRVLSRAHLVDERSLERFSLHDLLFLHARECASAEDSSDQRQAAVVRFLDHYLHSVHSADRSIRLSRTELPLTDREAVVEVTAFDNMTEAIAWCKHEHDMLTELCEFAAAQGLLEHAWQLPTAMWGYLNIHGSTDDYLRLNTIALDAARRLHNRFAEASALHTLGYTHKNMGHYEQSLHLLHEAFRIRQEIDHAHGIASTAGALGATYRALERYDEALQHDRVNVLYRQRTGDEFARGHALNALAYTLVRKGDFTEARETAQAAIDLLATLGISDPTVKDTLAQALFGLGDTQGAAQIYRDFLAEPITNIGSAPHAETMRNGAEVLVAAGDRQSALACALEALSIIERGGLAGADDVRRLVRDLEG